MAFDKFGYLGEQINDASREICQKYKELFDVCYDINQFAHKTRFELKIDSESGQQVIGCSLFIKILNGFQAIVLLYKVGLENEAKVITRTILEALFVLKSITNNKDEVVNFVNADMKEREKLLKVIFEKDKNNIYDDLKNTLNKEMLDKVKSEIKKQNIEEIGIYKWAEKAGLDMQYSYAYKALCADVHTNIRSLEKYVQFDENNKMVAIDCLPSTRDINGTLFSACYILLTSLQCMSEICRLNHDDEFRVFEEKITGVYELFKNGL